MRAWQRAALPAGVAALYFAAGWLGLELFTLVHPRVTAVWPATGVAVAAFLLYGYGLWPAILVAAILIEFATGGPVAWSLGGVGNVLAALLGAWLANRYARGARAFERAPDILRFAALSALGAPMLAATIGATSLTLVGEAARSEFAPIWLTWWLGDAAGILLVTPLLVLWHRHRAWYRSAREFAEVVGLLIAVTASGLLIFFHPVVSQYPLSFACLPPLLWAAFRCGQRDAALALAVLAVIATWATASGRGFASAETPNESLLVLQTFMAIIGTTTLVTAALVQERDGLLRRERDALARAEGASRAKDQFLAMLSHELRNPLGAISVATAVLDQLEPSGGETQRWRGTIHRQTEHLTRLIDDLLDVARITEGKLELRVQPVDLGESVTRCIRTLRSAGALQQHRTTIQPESVWVRADPDRLEQIITNLVMNAIKYTPSQGTVEVRTYAEGEEAVLRVSDSGIGISPGLLPKVFDLFAQGEQGLARVQGGLGIGLTLVRRLTELHGGRVEAWSAGAGRGSTFTIRLPRAAAAQTAAEERLPAPAASNSHHPARRVLIIEDNDDAREALRMLLVMTGNEVEEAADGESGVEVATRRPPDIALVDIGLPRVDGYEVARRIRASTPTVRLVAITGYGRDEDKARAREAGFDAHLLKPVSLDRLRRVMAQLAGPDPSAATEVPT